MLMLNELQRKIDNIDKLINIYSTLRSNSINNGAKKNYGFFIEHLKKQKLKIQELLKEIALKKEFGREMAELWNK